MAAPRKLKSGDFWRGLDALAKANGLSASGLAVKAGLDATAFNPSKRVHANGRERWPNTSSIAAVLAATGRPLEYFVALMMARKAAAGERQAGHAKVKTRKARARPARRLSAAPSALARSAGPSATRR